MVLPKTVRIAVEQTAFHFDKLYDYVLPITLGKVKRGCRVMVPFGGGNRKRQGIIVDMDVSPEVDKLKPVLAVLDKEPLIDDELLDLALWMKERTFCTVFDAVKSMIPTGLYLQIKPTYSVIENYKELKEYEDLSGQYHTALKYISRNPDGAREDNLLKNMGWTEDSNHIKQLVDKGFIVRSDIAFRRYGDATIRMVRLKLHGDELEDRVSVSRVTKKQNSVLELLKEFGDVSVKEIGYFCDVTIAVPNALEEKGLLEFYDNEILRAPSFDKSKEKLGSAKLNDEQKKAFDELLKLYKSGHPSASLLFGVTGSGKTQVYMNLIDEVLKDEKQVLVLVPEISLTPQITSLFYSRFGEDVAIMHSGLGIGERMDEWKRIKRGKAKIVVGTRSAVFAPMSKLGLIIMDEEQESTYKSDAAPRYHARDIAKFRCAKNNALLLLTSATPSIETYHFAVTGRYSFQKLNYRFGEADLPEVEIVDMKDFEGEIGLGIISPPLKKELDEVLEKGQQAILLLNRRGYNTFVSCRSCGETISCPSCSISLTYHRANNRLMCHYCGHSQPFVKKCPHCESDKVRYSGLGTQKVQEELAELFPDIKTLRMDTDTTLSKGAYETKFSDFAKGDYSIMLGTQMVAKGLDFPNVSLVGVLSADQALHGEDYRSFETTFALLTQVAGRAGRRDNKGKAVIQTFSPENYVINLAAKQDYPDFYETEIAMRKIMKYPPYTDIFMFGFVGTDEKKVRESSRFLLSILKKEAFGEKENPIPMIVLDPVPALVNRVAGKYRYKLLVKGINNKEMRNLVSKLLIDFNKNSKFRNVTLFIDVNPGTIM